MPWRTLGRPGPCSCGGGSRRGPASARGGAWPSRARWRGGAARGGLAPARRARRAPRACATARRTPRRARGGGAARAPWGSAAAAGSAASAALVGLAGGLPASAASPPAAPRRVSARGGLGRRSLGRLGGLVSHGLSSLGVDPALARDGQGAGEVALGRAAGRRCSPARRWRAGSAGRRGRGATVLMCSTSSSSCEVAQSPWRFIRRRPLAVTNFVRDGQLVAGQAHAPHGRAARARRPART